MSMGSIAAFPSPPASQADRMMPGPNRRLLREALHLSFGLIALASVTGLYFWLDFPLVSAAFTYLLVIVFLSLVSSFLSSIALTFIAIGFLNYFFTSPIFSFRIEFQQDVVAVAGFLITSLIVSGLVRRVRAEQGERMRASERLREAQRVVHVGYWEFDLGTERITFSDEASRIFGLTAREGTIAVDEATERIHPEDRPILTLAAAEAVRGGPRYDMDCRIVRPDGEVRFIHTQGDLGRDASGRPISMFGTVQDITDRKRLEEEQRYQMQLLKTVTDNASSMLYFVDAAGLGTFVNPSFERITGFRADEVIGRVVHDKIRPTKPDGTPYPVSECPWTGDVRQRSVVRGEEMFVRKDGTSFPVLYTASPIFREGAAVGTVIEVQDLTETKAAEAELRNRAKLLSLAHDAIFVRDLEGRITFWNPGAVKTYGWTAEEAIRRVCHELLQTRFPVSRRAVDIALQEQGEWEGEMTHITRQGAAIVVTSRQSLERDEHGAGVAILEINRDITDRKLAEQALRDSEEQWKAVFENNPTMYFMLDAAGTILSVNPFGAEQLGYTADELIGRPVLNVFYEPDREAVQKNAATCLEQPGQVMSWELRKIRKDGSMLWVRETGRAVLIKNRPVILIVCEDITERKRAEYLTGQVFETYPDAICVIGRDYRYQRVNPVYARTLEMPVEKLVGMHVADLLGTTFFEQMLKPKYDRCFAGEELSFTEWFTYPRRRRYLSASYSPLRPGPERIEGILVITRDLTDLVLASEALRSAQAELAHANRVATMGQLTASIAHEVNQPIAAAVTNAQAGLRWLSAQPPNFDEVGEALARIVLAGNRAGEVIGRIRALIKKEDPRKDLFAINDAILEVMALTRAEAANNGVAVSTELADGLPLLQGDRVELQQVLLNLIINAIESIRSLSEGNRDLLICTRKAELNAVLVEVRDSGPGFAPATVARLFDAFYTTKPSGLGLGLSICRSIIEAHNGRIWASPNVPRGAVFHFTVPAVCTDNLNVGVAVMKSAQDGA
jgi:PAS domain S-box-containing protein